MITVIFGYLLNLPHYAALLAIDCYHYIRDKWYLEFTGWGLHLYVGAFGAGKTCTMVAHAYKLACRFPQLSIVTNLKLTGFPAHTNILPLRTPQDIMNSPIDTLVLIDEIGTIFNSRDFSSSKQSVPKILFQHLCQCRKRHLMIYATTQRWNFLDKQLRDITATVRVTHSHFGHPFTRMCTVWTYDAAQYDLAFGCPTLKVAPLFGAMYVQTDKFRGLYDTAELIGNMLHDEYISDSEILQNRGELPISVQELDKRTQKNVAGEYKRTR